MRTLDEVIEIASDWTNGFDEMSIEKQMLHYLKMYRSDQIQWEAAREDWNEKWETFIVARERHLDAVKELKRNDPLTWDELKQMEGKPIWVEYNFQIGDRDARSRMWIIVQKIMPWRQDDELIYYSGFVFGKKEIGKTWQAYRKERA